MTNIETSSISSIKAHCCGADSLFDKKKAKKEYKKYLKNGPTRVTGRIITQMNKLLSQVDLSSYSMIDIGGGIGALQWWFLEKGGGQSIDVDASSGYLDQASSHANKMGWESQTKFIMGDCTDVYPELQKADIITLDKVVCCYPNYEEILKTTCKKSSQYIALSYPMDGFAAQVLRQLGVLLLKIIKNDYRPYVHSVVSIRGIFKEEKFSLVAKDFAFPWHIEIYRKD